MSFSSLEKPLVKICGLQSLEAAEHAVNSGAKLLGIICVPNRKRTVNPAVARQISQMVHSLDPRDVRLVGVFRNQSKEDVLQLATDYNVDIVQLHGDEPWEEYQSFLKKPIFKRMIFPEDCAHVAKLSKDPEDLCLFDSEAGGSGELLNWESIEKWAQTDGKGSRFILAGGLTPDNVSHALKMDGVIGVDVSGGVETDGTKDSHKVTRFLDNAYKTKQK